MDLNRDVLVRFWEGEIEYTEDALREIRSSRSWFRSNSPSGVRNIVSGLSHVTTHFFTHSLPDHLLQFRCCDRVTQCVVYQ